MRVGYYAISATGAQCSRQMGHFLSDLAVLLLRYFLRREVSQEPNYGVQQKCTSLTRQWAVHRSIRSEFSGALV